MLAPNGGVVGTIVVGVDGSDCARAALICAAREAALRGATLRVVCAWELPAAIYAGGFAPPIDQTIMDGFCKEAETVVEESVTEARRAEPTVACEGQVVEGHPASVLLDESRDASLVVVGSRGRGGFASLLLGSVSQHVVQHAGCPVLVVRSTAG